VVTEGSEGRAAENALEDVHEVPTECASWLTWATGLLLTTFAISLGAPFWFDLLGKVSNIKGMGKKPLTTWQETVLMGKQLIRRSHPNLAGFLKPARFNNTSEV
jgi:hypothetical protein